MRWMTRKNKPTTTAMTAAREDARTPKSRAFRVLTRAAALVLVLRIRSVARTARGIRSEFSMSMRLSSSEREKGAIAFS